MGKSPGCRSALLLNTNPIRNVVYKVVSDYAEDYMKYIKSSWYKDIKRVSPLPVIMFNRIRSNEKNLDELQTQPHIDSIPTEDDYMYNFATILYLNDEKECKGGTSFYRHKLSGVEKPKTWEEFHNIVGNTKNKYNNLITESNNDWEIIGNISMKFNRMVIYPTDLFHSGYIEKNDFVNYDRITQTAFF